jgi:NTE family protein
VLDALLEDGDLAIDGVSGTSAGAMNAAVMSTGYARGGRDGAREALRSFWTAVGGLPGCFGALGAVAPALPAAGPTGPVAPAAADAPGQPAWPWASPWSSAATVVWPAWMFNPDQWPLYPLLQGWTGLFSPYQSNPLNLNPLRTLLERHVDVALLRGSPLRVFVTATAVRTGQPRVFAGDQLTVDALLASACVPQVFQAVMIDGEAYWDGGYSGNPALWPLVYETAALDLVLVQINPLVREGTPTTAAEIADRINEITFNASLVAEMRAVAFVKRLLAEDRVDAARYKDLRLHRIHDEAGLAPFDASSKLNTDMRLLQALFELGRRSGCDWLARHRADVGRRSTLEIDQVFLAQRNGG